MPRPPILPCLAALLLAAAPARAEITLGAVLSLTGPAAPIGIPERDTVALLPGSIAGQPVRWVVLDDASDPATAVKAARTLIDESHVDAIVGASTIPSSLAILDVVAAAGVPTISLAASAAAAGPPGGPRRWAFTPVPGDATAAAGIVGHMGATGKRTLATIGPAGGPAGARGDAALKALAAAATDKVRTVAEARYGFDDAAGVAPQVVRILAARPDAVFVAAVPADIPIAELRTRGFTGPIYAVQGAAGPDALHGAGPALDGTILPAIPALVAEQLPAETPLRASALAYVTAYETHYGPGTRSPSGAALWDAFQLVAAAAPRALAEGEPGTPKFRTGLRNALEQVHGLPGAEAVFTLSPTDHGGAQPDSQVMVEIRGDAYHLLPAQDPAKDGK